MTKSFLNRIFQIPKNGFTLVEMIVALGIFSIVAVVALGALVKIISANHKAQTLQASITNLNFALDAMSREMRVGNVYHCDDGSSALNKSNYGVAGCTGASTRGGPQVITRIAFRSSEVGGINECNLIYAYLFDYNLSKNIIELKKARQSNCNDPITSASGGDFKDDSIILDPNVTIDNYYVDVTSATYPMATIRISGHAGTNEKEKTYFNVQTTVSARVQ
jgi:prepilin-type N-terminal cleavage/methylation domain-containing protein